MVSFCCVLSPLVESRKDTRLLFGETEERIQKYNYMQVNIKVSWSNGLLYV